LAGANDLAMRQTKSGVILSVYVRPSSGKNELAWVGDELHIQTKEPPEDNKANLSVIKIISKSLHVPQSAICIIRGQSDRKKEILIMGATTSGLDVALKLK
jgi:uncharacterized protein (TIGR00251 family)